MIYDVINAYPIFVYEHSFWNTSKTFLHALFSFSSICAQNMQMRKGKKERKKECWKVLTHSASHTCTLLSFVEEKSKPWTHCCEGILDTEGYGYNLPISVLLNVHFQVVKLHGNCSIGPNSPATLKSHPLSEPIPLGSAGITHVADFCLCKISPKRMCRKII